MGGVRPTIFNKNLVEQEHGDMVLRREREDAVLGIAREFHLDTFANLTWRTFYGKVIIDASESEFVHLYAPAFQPTINHL